MQNQPLANQDSKPKWEGRKQNGNGKWPPEFHQLPATPQILQAVPLNASNLPHSWHARRQSLLHAACKAVAALRQDGVRIGHAIALVARKFRGRSLGGGRKLPLSPKSLRHHWDVWNAADRDEFVFRNRQKPGIPEAELDPAILALIVSICVQKGLTLLHVLSTFPLKEAFGRPISKASIYRRLPAREIQKLALFQRRLTKESSDLEQQKASLEKRVLGVTVR
jgi:hypothetical protein